MYYCGNFELTGNVLISEIIGGIFNKFYDELSL